MAVTTHWVWTCDAGTRGAASALGDPGGTNHPTCTSGQGAWTELTYDDGGAFDPATIPAASAAGAFSAGFVLVGSILLFGWSVKALVRMVGGK